MARSSPTRHPVVPTVDADVCIGCELCYVTCGREVYDVEINDEDGCKATASRTLNCMVGCSTCAVVCPTQAITFASRDVVWKAEREYKIWPARATATPSPGPGNHGPGATP